MFIPSKLTVRLVAFFLVGLAVVATALADEYRTWTDSTGRHKLQAKFDSVKDGKVILIRENGSKVKIALEKLSKADQDYVAERPRPTVRSRRPTATRKSRRKTAAKAPTTVRGR